MYPDDLRYYKEHQWVRASDDDTGVVGITFFAQEQLGDIVYVDLPETGTRVEQYGKFGEIESVKSVSDLFAPVGGEIVELNAGLLNAPELVNQEPHGGGWMLRIKLSDPGELENLMTASEYEQALAE